jgi:hypothetical protein
VPKPRDASFKAFSKILGDLVGNDVKQIIKLTSDLPSTVLASADKETAEATCRQLAEAGGAAEIRSVTTAGGSAARQRYLCVRHGEVDPIAGAAKKVSTGKVVTGLLTGGASILATGVRSEGAAKQTILVCPRCKREVARA